MDLHIFCLQAWSTIAGTGSDQYTRFLLNLIAASQTAKTNLAIALHYLRLYKKNSINSIDPHENPEMANAVIVTSIILANKMFDDHCYTITTWINMINQVPNHPHFTVKLLTSLEAHFLACVDYRVLLHQVVPRPELVPVQPPYTRLQPSASPLAAHPYTTSPPCTASFAPSVYPVFQVATPVTTLVPTPVPSAFALPVADPYMPLTPRDPCILPSAQARPVHPRSLQARTHPCAAGYIAYIT